MTILEAEDQLRARLLAGGLSLDALDPWEAWKIFNHLLATPIEPDMYDVASFQCDRFEEPDTRPADFGVYFVRQFSRSEDGEKAFLKRVVLALMYPPAAMVDLASEEFWTDDFPTLAAFASVVERRTAFQAAMAPRSTATELYSEEL